MKKPLAHNRAFELLVFESGKQACDKIAENKRKNDAAHKCHIHLITSSR